MYLVFTRMPGESCRRRLRILLYSCYLFRALINSLVDYSNALLVFVDLIALWNPARFERRRIDRRVDVVELITMLCCLCRTYNIIESSSFCLRDRHVVELKQFFACLCRIYSIMESSSLERHGIDRPVVELITIVCLSLWNLYQCLNCLA